MTKREQKAHNRVRVAVKKLYALQKGRDSIESDEPFKVRVQEAMRELDSAQEEAARRAGKGMAIQ